MTERRDETGVAVTREPTSSESSSPSDWTGVDSPSCSQSLARWWYVLRYHRVSQLVMRLANRVRRFAPVWTGGNRGARRVAVSPRLRGGDCFARLREHKLAARDVGDSSLRARAILEGRLCFLNQEHALPSPLDWRLDAGRQVAQLWRFHLHYHEFLLDLAHEGLASGNPLWSQRAWELVADWIEHNRPDDPRTLADAWHPYCISRRLPAWMLLWSAFAPAEPLRQRVAESMAWQADFLDRHLEWDLRGNHLLENARTLVLAGTFFAGRQADRWLRKGVRILTGEIAEQVLPHGEHFERSPMYHALMLETVLDVRDATGLCAETAGRMARFLTAVLHPDGQIPLFGDSCFGQSASPQQLAARAAEGENEKDSHPPQPDLSSSPAAEASTVGDYWVYRHGGDFLIFDAGVAGPDHLPAHAHADLLGFEASVAGRRLFVDSGVFDYEESPMRRYCRSSEAHNVLQIDGCDQCDMWSRFRMGYRGWPSPLASGESTGFHWARAAHNAYRRLKAPETGRWLACRPDGPWFCVDWVRGQGAHRLTGRLHLHPEVDARQTAPDEVRLVCGDRVLRWRLLSPGELTLAAGWYCPEFGRRIPSLAIEYATTATLPAVSGWCLTWGPCEGTASLEPRAAGKAVLRWNEPHNQWQFLPLDLESILR